MVCKSASTSSYTICYQDSHIQGRWIASKLKILLPSPIIYCSWSTTSLTRAVNGVTKILHHNILAHHVETPTMQKNFSLRCTLTTMSASYSDSACSRWWVQVGDAQGNQVKSCIVNRGSPFLSKVHESMRLGSANVAIPTDTRINIFPNSIRAAVIPIIIPPSKLSRLWVVSDGDNLILLDRRLIGGGELVYGIKGFSRGGGSESPRRISVTFLGLLDKKWW